MHLQRDSKEEYRKLQNHLIESLRRLHEIHTHQIKQQHFRRFVEDFQLTFAPEEEFLMQTKKIRNKAIASFKYKLNTSIPKNIRIFDRRNSKYKLPWVSQNTRLLNQFIIEIDEEIQERKLEVQVAFHSPIKKDEKWPWWKKTLLRAFVLYLNFLQSAQAAQQAVRSMKRRQTVFPPFPLF